MGLDEADFARAFLVAFSDDTVVKKLSEVVTRPMKFDLDNLFDSNTKVLAELEKFTELNICLRKEVAELRDVIKQRNHTIEQLQMKLSTAEEMLDEQEQYSRRNSLRVSGIPEEPDETLETKVIDIFNKRLKFVPPMTENDLDRIHRVGKPDARSTPRQILIKFATYRSRQRVYKERKKIRVPKSNPQAPTTTDEESRDEAAQEEDDGPQAVIYINEDLTKKRATLLWKARNLVKDKQIRGCWSNDGRVFIENKFGHIKLVKNSDDLTA